MNELKELFESVGQFPFPTLLALLIILLLARIPWVSKLLLKIINGQDKNGKPRHNLSGEASVEFWVNQHREIVEKVIAEHEIDEQRRYDELRNGQRELSANQERIRERLHSLVSTVSTSNVLLEKSRAALDKSTSALEREVISALKRKSRLRNGTD